MEAIEARNIKSGMTVRTITNTVLGANEIKVTKVAQNQWGVYLTEDGVVSNLYFRKDQLFRVYDD